MKDTPSPNILRTALACAAGAFLMLGLSFAAVPLYDIFCRLTGFGGTPNRADFNSASHIGKTLSIRMDANTDPNLPWEFRPSKARFQTKIGETTKTFYIAKNLSQKPTKAQAVFNVSPPQAAFYVSKIECFCFNEQILEPGQTAEMPVTFFIDPEIEKDPATKKVQFITFSYRFYPSAD